MKHRFQALAGIVLISGALAAFAACAGEKTQKQDIVALVQSGGLLLDVRTAGEFASGHPEGALNIPVDQVPNRLAEIGPKDRAIVVYCQSGTRSRWATQKLKEAGYTQVIDIGSVSAWPKDASARPKSQPK